MRCKRSDASSPRSMRCARRGLARSLALGVVLLVGAPAAVGVAEPATAQAQGLVSYGVQANYSDDADFGIGARVIVGTADWLARTRVIASFDYYFPGSTERNFEGIGTVKAEPSFWQFNVNGHYVIMLDTAPANLYVGTGLHFYNGSVDVSVEGAEVSGFDPDGSGVGLNLLGGVEFHLQSRVMPFAEFRVEVGGAEQVVLTAGVRF